MGMRVSLGGLSMRRPARVPDPETALERSFAKIRLEIDELALRAPDVEHVALEDRDAGRVVAAIFETAQTVDQDVCSAMLTTDISNDSTHAVLQRLRVGDFVVTVSI